MWTPEYKTELGGPLFDGRLSAAVNPFLMGASEDLARHGEDVVWHYGKGDIREWTGNWGGHLTTERRADGWYAHDQGIVYGPWLEGTGSRNTTSRFKGYRMWRRAMQEIERKKPDMVQRSLIRSTLGKLLGGG